MVHGSKCVISVRHYHWPTNFQHLRNCTFNFTLDRELSLKKWVSECDKGRSEASKKVLARDIKEEEEEEEQCHICSFK